MTRSQAVIIAILIGFVALVFAGLIVVLTFPYDRFSQPSPPPTLTPVIVATPTLPNFMPTASLETPTVEPTATNTRVPTMPPPPPKTPTSPVIFELPTPVIKPTATPVPAATVTPLPTSPPSSGPPPTPIPRQYKVSFEADESTIVLGECTYLRWKVQGASEIMLDGKSIDPSDKKKVCPEEDTTYRLTTRQPGISAIRSKTVEISVVEEDDE